MFHRSYETQDAKCVTCLGDGDCKNSKGIVNSEPYILMDTLNVVKRSFRSRETGRETGDSSTSRFFISKSLSDEKPQHQNCPEKENSWCK